MSLNFDAEQHGKGVRDSRLHNVKTFIGSFGSEQKWGWLRSEKDIGREMAEAIRKGTLRTGRNNSLPIVYRPQKHAVGNAVFAPIVDITSSYCFRADRTKNGARVLNSVLSENKNGTPLPHIMPALGCEILGVNPSRGHVGFKRAISDSMRKKGEKMGKKRRLVDRELAKNNAPWRPRAYGACPIPVAAIIPTST